MSGRTRARRRIEPGTGQPRAAVTESVHDATARIKQAAERAAAHTTHEVRAHERATGAGSDRPVRDRAAGDGGPRNAAIENQAGKGETLHGAAVDIAPAETEPEGQETHGYLGQPTAERVARAANTAADLGGQVAHQLADRSQQVAGAARSPAPIAVAGVTAVAVAIAIAVRRSRRRR